jgi:hypothetical protein
MIRLQHAKSIVASISLLAAMLLCGAPGARAEAPWSIVVDIPFEFIVSGKTLPAGKYRVHKPLPDSDCVLYISKDGSDEGASFTTNAALNLAAPNKAALIFHHYGSEHYLSEVWTGSNNIGYRLPISKAEQAAARIGRPDESKGTSTGQAGKAAGASK